MVINNKYNIGDIVYLRTDIDALERIVTSIVVSEGNSIKYELSLAEGVSLHYENEITTEKTHTTNFFVN